MADHWKPKLCLFIIGNPKAGNYLAEKYGFRSYSFEDLLKQIVETAFHVPTDDAHKDIACGGEATPRNLLEEVGDFFYQSYGMRLDTGEWISIFAGEIWAKMMNERPERAVITDLCRSGDLPLVSFFGGKVVLFGDLKWNTIDGENYSHNLPKVDYRFNSPKSEEELAADIDEMMKKLE